MPTHPEEIEQTQEEGVVIHFLTVPIKIGGEKGRVQYLECLQQGRFDPCISINHSYLKCRIKTDELEMRRVIINLESTLAGGAAQRRPS